MTRTNRLLLDVGILVGLIVAFFPAGTGISVHEWVSVATFVMALVHLVINWDWVMRTAARILGKLRAAPRINLIVDAVLFVATITVMVSGMMVSQVIARTLGVTVTPDYVWHVTHSVSAKAVMALTAVHLGLHWDWIAVTTRGLIAKAFPANDGALAFVPIENDEDGRYL